MYRNIHVPKRVTYDSKQVTYVPNEVTLWLLRNHESIITREFITSRKELSFSLFINDLRK